MKKLFFVVPLASVIMFVNAKTGENDVKKTDVKQNSTFFKMSRNSNRLSLFEQLQSSIKVKSARVSTNPKTPNLVVQYTTYSDVVELLGEPNVAVKKSTFIYTLNPTNGCKGIIEFDTEGYVVYMAIKDCK